MMYLTAQSHLIVDGYSLIPGCIGIVVIVVLYGFLSKWGFFKHKWLVVKWILIVLLVALGVGSIGVAIKENMVYAQKILTDNADVSIVLANVRSVAIALIFSICVGRSNAKFWLKALRIVVLLKKPKNKGNPAIMCYFNTL